MWTDCYRIVIYHIRKTHHASCHNSSIHKLSVSLFLIILPKANVDKRVPRKLRRN